MSFSDPSASSTATGNLHHLYMNHPASTYAHYQPQPNLSASNPDQLHQPQPPKDHPIQHHSYHHASVFQAPNGGQQQHHPGMVAPASTSGGVGGVYSSSYSAFQRPSDSYSSSLNLEDPPDSANNESVERARQGSATSSSNSQPTSPSYPPGMNPNEHRKSCESADIKHRRRTTKSQFQVLENTFQRDFKPTSQTRQQLAAQLGMEPRAVQIWFQNRRAKAKATAKREEAIARGEPIEFPVHGGKVSDRAPKSRAVLASLMKRAEEVKEARRLSESQQGASSSRERDELDNSDDENGRIQRHLAAARASTGSSLISPVSSTSSERSPQESGYSSAPASASASHLPTLTSLYDSGSTPYRFGTAQSHIPGVSMGGEGVNEDGRSRSSTGASNDFSNSSAWQSRRPSAMSTLSTNSNSSNPSYMSATSYGNPSSSSMLLQQPPPGSSYSRLAQGDGFPNLTMAGAGPMHYHSSSYPSYSSIPHMAGAHVQSPYGHPGHPDFSAYPPAARYRSFPNVFPGSVPQQHQQHGSQQSQSDHDLHNQATASERPYAESFQYPSNFDAEIRRVSCPDSFSAFSSLLPLQGMFLNNDRFNSNEQEEDEENILGSKKDQQQQMQCQDFIQSTNLQFPSHPAYDMAALVSFTKNMKGGIPLHKSSEQQRQFSADDLKHSQDKTGDEFLADTDLNDYQDSFPIKSESDHDMRGDSNSDEEGNDFFDTNTPSLDGSSRGHNTVGSDNSTLSNISPSTKICRDVQSPSPITSHSVMTPTDG